MSYNREILQRHTRGPHRIICLTHITVKMEDPLTAKDLARIRRQQISLNYVDCRPKEVFIDKGKAGHANNYTTTQNDATTIISTLANSNIPSAPLPKPSHSIQSVYIPHLTSASKFYLQLASREDELNRMSERIAEATMTAEDVSTKDLAVNMPCLAIFEEAWYRGIIIEREEKNGRRGRRRQRQPHSEPSISEGKTSRCSRYLLS